MSRSQCETGIPACSIRFRIVGCVVRAGHVVTLGSSPLKVLWPGLFVFSNMEVLDKCCAVCYFVYIHPFLPESDKQALYAVANDCSCDFESEKDGKNVVAKNVVCWDNVLKLLAMVAIVLKDSNPKLIMQRWQERLAALCARHVGSRR